MADYLGIDPFRTDRTPFVSVEINGVEYDRLSKYSYDSDILQIGDPFSVVLPDPWGHYKISRGDSIKLYMADPEVQGGKKVQKVTGVVTQVKDVDDPDNGTVFNIAGADLGWHLVNDDAPIWKRLEGMTFGKLFTLLVDPTWGFQGFADGNDANIKVKLGGNHARSVAQLGDTDKPPIVQIDPGDKPADFFINFAKLANKLVNVSYNGVLQLFAPRYDTPVAYRFFNYRDKARAQARNNVKSSSWTQSLDGVWTEAVCVGTRLIPAAEGVDPNDPNANNFRGTYKPTTAPLAFNRLVAFADPDRLNRAQAAARAKWKIQRGIFDSWIYEITVRGHSQNGNFYEPDTMCEVVDERRGFNGTFYVSAVRYNRDESGTTTALTIRLPNLLAA